MPAKPIRIGIILFWIFATGWFMQREFLPRWLSNKPPVYLIDLADEVGAKEITWQIYDKEDKEIGYANTQVKQLPNGRYELQAELLHLKLGVQNMVDLDQCTSSYIVDTDGHLLELSSSLSVKPKEVLELSGLIKKITVTIHGKVTNGELVPKTSFSGIPDGDDLINNIFPQLKTPIPVSGSDSVINITHPFNRLRDLHEGQEWGVPVFSPLPSLNPDQETNFLFAKVFKTEHDWKGQNIPCWRVDLRDKDSELKLRIIVRQEDGLVLQHEAYHDSLVLKMKRSS